MDAKESGELQDGQTIVELTNGNTGASLAILCTILGHPFVAVISTRNSMEQAHIIKALGSEVVIVNWSEGGSSTAGKEVSDNNFNLVKERARELTI